MQLNPQDWYGQGERFHWQGNDVFYRRMGQGPAMLMIHGFPTAGCDWAEIAESLQQHFTLIVPDLLDYGQSHNPSGSTFSLLQQADMLEALLTRLEIGEVHLLAHDVGDSVAQELLARQIEGNLGFSIQSGILMNGGVLPSVHRPRTVQKALLSPIGPWLAQWLPRKKFMQALAEVFGPDTRPGPAALNVLWEISIGINGRKSLARRIHYMNDRKQHEQRWVNALKNADLRLMMINGVEDPISGEHLCRALEQQIPSVEISRLPGIGHFPLLEAAQECLRLILDVHGLENRPSAHQEN